ncbi:hypothetical protein HHK36_012961 [Tetracentron sinense]|uniref:Translation initiation factor beta propellor-like domain-containing protein n=1 Tax=Tetracentron sinense TaxID=13715 RepID=A0A834ZAA1_TETSI|nr:hypothetical protein HHK36_012961 [Tetracentron sinense]
MGGAEYYEQESSPKRRKTLRIMEDTPVLLGSQGLIKRHEFVRIIIQCLNSLGYKKSASCLELESGISYKSSEFDMLESQILNGNCNHKAWVDIIDKIKDLKEETRASALFLIYKQYIFECLYNGDDSMALKILQDHISALSVGREKVHKLASGIISLKDIGVGKKDDSTFDELRRKLLSELEMLLPPPIAVPEKRLEHLVEMALTSQMDSCIYHNSSDNISLYEDHCCSSDQIPTKTVQILTHHNNEVWFVQFSNSGEYLASSSSDCTAIIWKVLEDGKMTLKHTLHSQKPVSFVAWSPNDTMLLTCGNGEVLKLWDVETGICKHTFGEQSPIVSSCAWFPDSEQLVCGSSHPENCIYMWDLDGKELKAWKGARIPKVLDLAVTPDGEHLISILSENDIRIVNLKTNDERVIKEKHAITSLSVSGDSKRLIVNLNSQEIHMWDIAGPLKQPWKYTGHKQGKYVIRSCFGGSNCQFIASGSENSQVCFCCLVFFLVLFCSFWYCFAFAALLSKVNSKFKLQRFFCRLHVYIWNQRSKEPIQVLSGHSMTVNCVSWNPKRPQMLASASDDQTIRIWGSSRSQKKV